MFDLELYFYNVYCSVLCLGLMFSEFYDVMGICGLVSKLLCFMWMIVEEVVNEGYDVLMEGKLVYVIGLVN